MSNVFLSRLFSIEKCTQLNKVIIHTEVNRGHNNFLSGMTPTGYNIATEKAFDEEFIFI